MKWFVEERNFRGRWVPAVYYSKEPPSEKRTESSKRTFRSPPVAVKVEHDGLDLKGLQAVYGKEKENAPDHQEDVT